MKNKYTKQEKRRIIARVQEARKHGSSWDQAHSYARGYGYLGGLPALKAFVATEELKTIRRRRAAKIAANDTALAGDVMFGRFPLDRAHLRKFAVPIYDTPGPAQQAEDWAKFRDGINQAVSAEVARRVAGVLGGVGRYLISLGVSSPTGPQG